MEYELYHHGILGMKWGIRRYQNKDGTLTEEGKKRQQKRSEAAEAAFSPGAKGKPSRAEKIASEVSTIPSNVKSLASGIRGLRSEDKPYDLSSMSDDELRSLVNRMNLERTYASLKSSDVSRGEAKLNRILEITGGVVGIASSAVAIGTAIWQIKKHKSSGE